MNTRIAALVLPFGLQGSLVLAAEAPKPATPAAKPNIIMILSDDVGLGDIGCCGGGFKTPNIDALARDGLRFPQCYAMPLCGPTRCVTLTGRYPFRTGLIDNHSQNAIAPSREIMIPTVMKKAGYVTGSVGKWGQMCLGPSEWGFDEYLVFPGSGRYWREQTTYYTVNGQQKNLPAGVYLPDLMHEFVTGFLTRHREQPFFLYYPMSHCHGPIVRTPDSKGGVGKDRLYADNIAYMDKLVGKLVAELDRLGLRENTLIIFTGDNGTARFGTNTVNGRELSGRKGSMLEGGARVPLIASWPAATPRGKVLNDLVDFSDFFATFADLGGAKLPEGVKIDGHSFAPQLRGEKGLPREWAFVQLGQRWYVRDQNYKLTESGVFFDLKNAPFVEKLVAADSTDEAAITSRRHLQEALAGLAVKNPSATADPGPRKKLRKKKKQ